MNSSGKFKAKTTQNNTEFLPNKTTYFIPKQTKIRQNLSLKVLKKVSFIKNQSFDISFFYKD
jgi:hypothetical protein